MEGERSFGEAFDQLKIPRFRPYYVQYRFLKRLIVRAAGAVEESNYAVDNDGEEEQESVESSAGSVMTGSVLGPQPSSDLAGTPEELEVLAAFDTELHRIAGFVTSKITEVSSVLSFSSQEAVLLC